MSKEILFHILWSFGLKLENYANIRNLLIYRDQSSGHPI